MSRSAPRTLVEFRTDIPDDIIFDDEGDIVRFGGEAVASALGEMLAAQGLTIDGPDYEDEHGFTFIATRPGFKIWVQVTLIDEVVVMTQDMTFRWKFWENPTDYADTLERLDKQMKADGRFHELVWFFPKEHDSRGAGSPTPIA